LEPVRGQLRHQRFPELCVISIPKGYRLSRAEVNSRMVAIVQQTPASKQRPAPRYVERFLTWLDRAGIARESVRYPRSGEGRGEVAALKLVPPTGLGLRTPVLFAHATGND